MADSSSFFLLDERIRHFIWTEGWESLRDVQEASIPPILGAATDVVIAAATAAGKTEAAFLPALTRLLQTAEGGLIVYISPLKALINDQFSRLERLCERLEIPVWPWHGDISATQKTRFLKKPSGVLLITPESLEAMLCNRGTSVANIFASLLYVIIDELHAFIGSERGKQVQSLLHRIETATRRRVPRIGLSATLGDMGLAANYLRPGTTDQAQIIVSNESDTDLRILVKGYVSEPVSTPESASSTAKLEQSEAETGNEGSEEEGDAVSRQIASHLFSALRGSNNLIFPNSRREVERYTFLLTERSAELNVPNEFYPHHGSLSKEIREETERALKQKERPATAICTSTLELGIDIGAVKSVAQIGAPPSVASLRQRLGRSGRRKGEPAILRGYCIEDTLTPKSTLESELRLGTVKMAAMISLMLEGWFEPPRPSGTHYSTLIQQVLSAIAQYGGLTIGQLNGLLCLPGAPFDNISKEDLIALIRTMGEKELLIQDSSGCLLHGRLGEKFVNHYSFYAAFPDEEEYRIVAGGRTLGSIPTSQMLLPGHRILFAGKTWIIDSIDDDKKIIYATRAKANQPPLFSGEGGRMHTKIRARMREILAADEPIIFLDKEAQHLISEGRESYIARELATTTFRDEGNSVRVFTWLGDAANEALACLISYRGYQAVHSELGIEVKKDQGREIEDVIDSFFDLSLDVVPSPQELIKNASNLKREKWDWALPEELLIKGYVQTYFDIDEATAWIRSIVNPTPSHTRQ